MPDTVTQDPIAVIGLGCVLPDAPDVESFWNNLRAGKSSIRDVSADRWDPALYYDADKAPDKTYTKVGAFVTDDNFDGMLYRMPPKVVEQIDQSQRWALSATRQAMLDAGYLTGLRGDSGKEFDRDRCAVILGNAMGGESNKIVTKRLFWPEARQAILDDADFQALPQSTQESILGRAEERYKSTTVPVTEDTMPGHLSNVMAGRIANAFDLGGKNFTTDAACASSLAALDAAVETLRKGGADMVVWGGSDRSMDVTPYVQFSAIGALSPDGSRPFDKGANGFVMGEGCAIFILKRLADAERDGDTIYAVVRGVGGSSDGKGKGITAPNPKGQVKAVKRSYEDAEMDPFTIGYLEAHGTSTPVGDPVELTSVIEAFQDASNTDVPVGSIYVGSVKSNIGHLKAGAGAAGMLKAVLALHHGHIPASINVKELNPRIDWQSSPFQVATSGVDWPDPENHPRRAGLSSFGFGGTNFHVALEAYRPGALVKAKPMTQTNPTSSMDTAAFAQHMKTHGALEWQGLVLDADALPGSLAGLPDTVAFPDTPDAKRVRDLFYELAKAGTKAERRVGIAPQSLDEIPKKLALAEKAASNPAAGKLAFQQGVFLGQGKPSGKVAFLFPGQGTQYVNMGRDLAQKYAVVRHTFEEADAALQDELDGVKLTDILWPTPNTPENQKASNEKLKLTEFTQPAVLAMDVAMLRLLKQWDIQPDMVAGHSLGEYGALVAAGVLSFTDALHAVAARGREMANVDLPDLGKMASIPADWETVTAAIEGVEEYVICANKNCPSQTVIAGSSAGVDQAVAKLSQQGLQCMMLPVSAAFHSDIVAPASGPLRNVLARLDVKSPKVTCLTNVGAVPYPEDPEAIRDNLATQVASPVEWIGIIERMVDEGVTTFIEVGPKKALTGFCMDILKDRMGAPDGPVAICSNHPKKGEIQHVNELFAFLGAFGFEPRLPELNDPAMYTAEFRDPTAAFRNSTPAGSDLLTSIMARLDALEARNSPPPASPSTAATPGVTEVAAPLTQRDDRLAAFGLFAGDIGISGISIGLPGADKPLFAPDNWDRILRGDNLIDSVPENERAKLAAKNIVRLVKRGDGNARFEIIDDVAQVIKLAGRRGDFDMSEWGMDGDFASTLDRTFQYAIAAGIEALRDAGIPLQRSYMQTSTGSYLPKDWKLPESMQRETGIVFASAFPGYDNLLREVSQYLADKYAGRTLDELQRLYADLLGAIDSPELKDKMSAWFEGEFHRLQDVLPDHGASRYEFNRKFLFNVLSLGHAQLAQFIGAKGPNTQLNAACASTTQAIAVAEDWIRTGRCKRVLVVGADDVTSDAMFEWVGSGFLASGAATVKADVAEAALPFDARRHGMIVGMGAVGLVVEQEAETEARGMRPIAKLLATQIANSAFHGSRLDIEDIAWHMQELTRKAGARYGIEAATIAPHTVFMSHETYTPARGGSASAEIHALRATFGDHANKVIVANTKGFTGHPQGAGVEDAIALKCMQRGVVPPIANFRDADPELGNLNLSKGGPADVRFALRLAAGFGSQVAMTLTQLVAREDERIASQAGYDSWLETVSGLPSPVLEVQNRTLRIVDQGAPANPPVEAKPVAPEPVALPATPTAPQVPATPAAPSGDALEKVTAVIAEKTGYPADMLEPDLDMEADLGIDTVKQAELFAELRQMFGVELDESLQLKDYNTLGKVAQYMAGGQSSTSSQPELAAPQTTAEPTSPPAASTDALETVTQLVASKTGYPAEMLEPDLDMEADLGIDTVKQAELFGELRAHFGVPLDESLSLADYNTLRKVAKYMGGSAAEPAASTPTPPAPAAAPEPEPAAPAAAPTADSNDVLQAVTAMVAEQTGYPADMLEPDLDMEADLGIDTVKQAEIFAALRERFSVPLREDLSLAEYNTLSKVAQYMASNQGSGSVSEPEVEAAPVSTADIVRRIPTLRPEPAPTAQSTAPKGKLLVLGDPDMVVLDGLKKAGWSPVHDGDDIVGIACIATRKQGDAHEVAGKLFDAVKAHQEAIQRGLVLVVTAQDGAHGTKRPRDPAMAALAGLGKALRKELPDALVKVIDVHPDLKSPGQAVADELTHGGPRTEICFDRTGRRFVVDVTPAPDAGSRVPDVMDQAFVVSGGAQGITVEMLAALAPQNPKFLLLGRTEVPSEAAQWATWSDAQWKDHEATVIAAMKERGEKVTPVTLQKAMSPLQKAAEVRRNLDRLTELGATVLYAPVDVQDKEAVNDAVTWARDKFGGINGVIHAAGVEISKDIANKPREQFDLVFGIKHDGLHALMEATKEDSLRWLISFGSVAGRFGNLGQTDYSAVNEYLCKAVHVAGANRRIPTAFTIAWGPWAEVGMATKGSIMQIMEASGVTPIPTQDGVAQFLDCMAAYGLGECVVAGEVGAIDLDHQVSDHVWDPRVDALRAELANDRAGFRLLGDIASATSDSLVATVRMSRSDDPYPDDHAIDGVPYLPGVFGLEAFAEAARLLVPDDQCIGFLDASFGIPVKQLKDTPAVAQLSARRMQTSGDETHVKCQLTTRMVGPDGVARGEPRVHFEATVRMGDRQSVRTQDIPTCTRERAIETIYPPFFHGPSFQVLRYAGPLGDESIGMGFLPAEPCFSEAFSPQSHPLVTEMLFQLCGLRTMQEEGAMSLPAGIEQLDLLEAEVDGEVRLWCRFNGEEDGMRRFDAAACTDDGQVIMRVLGYAMVETGPAPEADQPIKVKSEPEQPQQTLSVDVSPADLEPIPLLDVDVPDLDGVAFAAVAVEGDDMQWFTADEQMAFEDFATPKRAAEWRAGRLAAKAVVLAQDPSLSATDVTVVPAESGRPVAHVKGVALDAHLSITHRDGIALAALANAPLGIDLETVEARSDAWKEESFNEQERASAEDDAAAACMWAAKEAVFKRIGTGLRTPLHAWTVLPDEQGGATVTGENASYTVSFFDVAGRVLAVCHENAEASVET